MSIKINHSAQDISVTDTTTPLTFDAKGGLWLKTTAPIATAGILAYDYNLHVLKYHNNTEWVILGSVSDVVDKARKQNSADFGGAGGTAQKYLTVSGSTPVWLDPTSDGFLRFNGAAITLNPAMSFNSPVTFNSSVNCNGNVVRNIVQGAANDAIPRSYVDAAIITSSSTIVSDLNISYAEIITKYQNLIAEIYNTPFPAAPTVPPVIVPPIVVPPPVVIPPNPPKEFTMNYDSRILGINEQVTVLANWAQQTATTMNGLNGQPRVPAVGSTFYVTFKQKSSYNSGNPKGGSVIIDRPKYVRFNWTGSSSGIVDSGNL